MKIDTPQLFLIHFAGGNRYSFNFLDSFLSRFFQLIPLELPGRGNRIHEKLHGGFEVAAFDIFKQIQAKLTSPRYLIFGHSMGASLGLRVCNLMIQQGAWPSCLIVSGNSGPMMNTEKTSQLNRQAFIQKLQKLGGTPSEVLENEEMFSYFEPILRSDFSVAEDNELVNEPAVNIPLFALMGNQEGDVDNISNWRQYTSSYFEHKVLEGGHFFIYDHPEMVAQYIKRAYDKSTLLCY